METEPNIAGTVFAGCKIICKLGQGGMGSVYKAHQEALDKFVCVKLLAPELAREQRNIDFFLREARSAAKLDHPNIVHIYNFGQENNAYFIVMSYVEGKTLQDIVAERGPLPVKEATGIMSGVLQGLAHAHANSIIHRDIKPSNILVGPDNVPRIVDFGLARSISEEKQLTMAGEMVGTAYFMSPEQGLAGKVDSRADLYAAGATYFYILTGKYPFDGKSSIEVIHKHISDSVPNVVLLRPDVPLWACRIIERLMRKKPEDRYQTAGEILTEFGKYASEDSYVEKTSNETTFDMPEFTARMNAIAAAPQASLERSTPHQPSGEPPPPPPAAEQPAARQGFQDQAPPSGQKPALQFTALYTGLKMALHLALTLAGTGCFVLAGASGATPGSLSSPFFSNPVTASMLALLGVVLYGWALWQKPLKFTLTYTFFALAAAAAAYSGGAYLPAPQGADMAARGLLVVRTSLENAFLKANFIVYALFLYLVGAKAVFKEKWIFRGLAAAAYLGSLALTYGYFYTGAEVSADQVWLAACGLLVLLGLAAALTQKEFSIFFSPQFFFLAANLVIFSILANSQIGIATAHKERTEAEMARRTNDLNQMNYQRALQAAQSEAIYYDLEGRPLEPRLPAMPEEVKPPDLGRLQDQARLEYNRSLGQRILTTLPESAGIIFLAFFLTLMANACFIEELITAYRERELY